MADNQIAILTLGVTALIALANLIAALAAARNARIAAQEFRLTRRPLLRVDWTTSVGPRALELSGVVREIANMPTTLHHIEVSAASLPRAKPGVSSAPFNRLSEGPLNVTLFGDKVTHEFGVLADPQAGTVFVAVVLRASAGGPSETLRYDTRFRYRQDSSTWEVFAHPPSVDFAGRRRWTDGGVFGPVREAWQRWWDQIH